MELIEISLKIALEAYQGQVDKAGKTYILHPLRLMHKLENEDEMAVALLHDVIEDSDFTALDLLNRGIPKNIVTAVEHMTKIEGETYDQFINRVSANELAVKVKLVDIEDNINVLRLDDLSEKDLKRVLKYHCAWKTLMNYRRGK